MGGVHASAPDVARFLAEFRSVRGGPETRNGEVDGHQPQQCWPTPRGSGFRCGPGRRGSPGCSEQTFGHTGSTGTVAWADLATETICVVLTSLPGSKAKAQPQPRDVAATESRRRGQLTTRVNSLYKRPILSSDCAVAQAVSCGDRNSVVSTQFLSEHRLRTQSPVPAISRVCLCHGDHTRIEGSQ